MICFSRHADPTVVVMMDPEGLKHIHDTFGHAAHDDCVKASTDVLRDCVKDQDVVARLGGDEFDILIRGCTTIQAAEVVDRIQERLDTAGVSGSLRWSPVTLLRGFPDALAYAETQMYAMKASRRVERACPKAGEGTGLRRRPLRDRPVRLAAVAVQCSSVGPLMVAAWAWDQDNLAGIVWPEPNLPLVLRWASCS